MTPAESPTLEQLHPTKRRTRIGGSEIGAVLGCDPYRDAHALWVFKRGFVEPGPPNIRMKLGLALEPGVLKLYADETGYTVTPGGHMCHHLTIPYMVYSPDGLIEGERRGVDAKVVAYDQRHHWGEDPDHVPAHLQLQCHWYMAAMAYDYWDLAVVFPGLEFRRYTVERDPVFEEWILERAEEYWQRYLIGDEEPPLGASESSRRYLEQRFPRNTRPIRPATAEEITKLEEFGDLRSALKRLETAKDTVANELFREIGDHDGLSWSRGRMTWKLTKDTLRTDWESLADSVLKTYAADERSALEHHFTETKKGYRRIYYRREGEDE
jgi:putative phage-type endonuclease